MILWKSARGAFIAAGIRTGLFGGMYLAAVLLKNPGIGMVIWLLNGFEFLILGPCLYGWLISSGVFSVEIMYGSGGTALIGLLVFADTFVVKLLFSLFVRGISRRFPSVGKDLGYK